MVGLLLREFDHSILVSENIAFLSQFEDHVQYLFFNEHIPESYNIGMAESQVDLNFSLNQAEFNRTWNF